MHNDLKLKALIVHTTRENLPDFKDPKKGPENGPGTETALYYFNTLGPEIRTVFWTTNWCRKSTQKRIFFEKYKIFVRHLVALCSQKDVFLTHGCSSNGPEPCSATGLYKLSPPHITQGRPARFGIKRARQGAEY